MKRRVLCIFVLILWGLVFCTMLSVRIEQLMIPEVVLTQADESELSPHIALDSLFFDDTGMHLYRPREGTGWETGTRIYEEEINNYSVGENQLDLKFFGSYVRYASKPLRSGDEISIKSDLRTGTTHGLPYSRRASRSFQAPSHRPQKPKTHCCLT